MPYLLIRHRVSDFDRWYSDLKSHGEAQREGGFGDLQLLRDVKDPHIVVCLFKVYDVDKARAFTQTLQSSEAQNDSGFSGQPEVFLLKEI
jgi:hypothetical protein